MLGLRPILLTFLIILLIIYDVVSRGGEIGRHAWFRTMCPCGVEVRVLSPAPAYIKLK